MRPLTIVQARMGSSRLPGKVLMDLAGQTVLERVIRQLRKCKQPLGQIVVATTARLEDDAVKDEAVRLHVPWFHWYTDDVLERFERCHREAEKHYGETFDTVVRVTADCPLLDPGLLGQVVELVVKRGYDYAGVRGVPAGYDCEAFTAEILHAAHRWAKNPDDREHVVPWMIRNGDCGWIEAAIPGDPVEVNTMEDLERIGQLV